MDALPHISSITFFEIVLCQRCFPGISFLSRFFPDTPEISSGALFFWICHAQYMAIFHFILLFLNISDVFK